MVIGGIVERKLITHFGRPSLRKRLGVIYFGRNPARFFFILRKLIYAKLIGTVKYVYVVDRI